MERYYNIAGINICVSGKDDEMFENEYRLEPFRTEKRKPNFHYRFSIVEKLDDVNAVCIYQDASKKVFQDGVKRICYIGVVAKSHEGAYMRTEMQGNEIRVQVMRKELPDRITSKVVLNAMEIGALMLEAEAFILHAAFINVNGKAVLFTAPSGTGKSTQAELWKQFRGADIINGDRAVVKVQNGDIEVYGLPFCGSSEYCKNARLPLAAVVCLEQATKTVIEPMRGMYAFRKIWEEITIPVWEDKAIDKISGKLTEVLASVPVYRLACTPDESAVIELENMLNTRIIREKEDL